MYRKRQPKKSHFQSTVVHLVFTSSLETLKSTSEASRLVWCALPWQESWWLAWPAQSLLLQHRAVRRQLQWQYLLPPKLRDSRLQTTLTDMDTHVETRGHSIKGEISKPCCRVYKKCHFLYWVGLFSFTWSKVNKLYSHLVLKRTPCLSPNQLL